MFLPKYTVVGLAIIAAFLVLTGFLFVRARARQAAN